MDEAQFKQDFRLSLEKSYGDDTFIWPLSDRYNVGYPDTEAVWEKNFFAIEAKYVSQVPKRDSSKLLSHELTAKQSEHLFKVYRSGNKAIILVGMKDIAVAVPYHLWPQEVLPGCEPGWKNARAKPNITLGQIKKIKEMGYYFTKDPTWKVSHFFQMFCHNQEIYDHDD